MQIAAEAEEYVVGTVTDTEKLQIKHIRFAMEIVLSLALHATVPNTLMTNLSRMERR